MGESGLAAILSQPGSCGSTFKNIFQNLWRAAEVKVECEVRHLTGTKFDFKPLAQSENKME